MKLAIAPIHLAFRTLTYDGPTRRLMLFLFCGRFRMRFYRYAAVFAVAAVALAACGGGGGGGGGNGTPPIPGPTLGPTATPAPTATPVPSTAPTAAPQVIGIALPVGTMGSVNDATFGLLGGFTQNSASQVLGFVPGAQVMVKNIGGSVHTLNVIGTSGFGTGTSATSASGSSFTTGYSSGLLSLNQTAGPFTLAAGTYYIGCGVHYSSNTMRDVVIVAPNATPGPQATPVPQPTGTNPPNTCPGGYC